MISNILQLIVGLGLLNVWLIRASKETDYRGGEAKNLKDEFATYGLPEWFYYLIGFLKVSTGLALIIGVWVKSLVPAASMIVVFLMLGAIGMHVKVGDDIKKYVPASAMLLLSFSIYCL